jgi:hypothetical protein
VRRAIYDDPSCSVRGGRRGEPFVSPYRWHVAVAQQQRVKAAAARTDPAAAAIACADMATQHARSSSPSAT